MSEERFPDDGSPHSRDGGSTGSGTTHDGHARTQRLPTVQQPVPPGSDRQSGAACAASRDVGRARRFWSARRVPAAIVALVLLAASGFLLYDVVSVRAGQPGMHWRRWLAHKLSTVHLDNTWVMASTAAIAAIGLWLVVMALTPGLRHLLPMQRPCADIRAGLDRSAAGLILRDRAMEVPGVQSAKLSVGRRRAKARAVSHFRDLDDVSKELHTTLDQELRQLGLARQPKVSVRAKRAKK
ncbi:DUF6286 domain-containing protein [Streptomyces sp. B8F3]|uniref:DUF6286 domain-containing protein n=1 Tax=Streptomyces sp. B8F3 TaxID=3153573 RepID=UPI00325EA497